MWKKFLNNKFIKIIFGISLFVAATSIILFIKPGWFQTIANFILDKEISYVKSKPICSQKVNGSGGCMMLMYGYQFNKFTQKCERKSVGGCSLVSPFVSKEECEKTCIQGWEPTTAFEKVLYQGKLSFLSQTISFKSDSDGARASFLNLNKSESWIELYSSNARFVDSKILAILESDYEDSRGKTYITLFIPHGKNVFIAEEIVKFGEERVGNTEVDSNGNIVTVTYEEMYCGGYLPPCGTKFTKKFEISGNILIPLQ